VTLLDSVVELIKKIYKYVIVIYLFFSGAFLIFMGNGKIPFVVGFTFGTLISVLTFFELARTTTRAVTMDPGKAKGYAMRHYFLRFIITGFVIYISITAPYINAFGTFIGLLLIKFVIYFTNLFNDKNYFKNIFVRKEDK